MVETTADGLFARIHWGAVYCPAWDAMPETYLEAGLLKDGKARRLGRLEEPSRRFRAYFGVQHAAARVRWGSEEYIRFFVSLMHGKRVLTLQTHPTMQAALAQAWAVYQRLPDERTSG